ncbi:MAG: MarR family winged helix-turn-helix transcriptional regulator [Armatimonadota bacterium]
MAGVPLGSKVAALHELQSAWLEPCLRAEGLSWSTFQLLVTISGIGTASQVDIARDLGVTPATLSESVHSLVGRGLVEQVPGERDRRVKVLRLTSAATAKLAKVRTSASECEKVMVDGVSQRDLEACSKVLDALIGRLEQALTPAGR